MLNNMTKDEHLKVIDKVANELKDFEENMLSLSKTAIYESAYKIHTYQEFSIYLIHNGEKLNFAGIPKNNILDYFYSEFLKTSYDLTRQDIIDFFDEETKMFAKDRQEEM